MIERTEDLALFGQMVNLEGKDFRGKTVALGLSMDIAASQWTPVGTTDRPFMGTFDGDGHTISGLWVDGEADYTGFFHTIGSEGCVRNLHLVIADRGIKGGNRVAGLAGACHGEVSHCAVTGNGTIAGLGYTVGGLIGSSYSGSVIQNSYTDVPVRAADAHKVHIGGLIGYLDRGTVSNSYATGAVAMQRADTCDVGGLIGYQKEGVITNCYATGTITVEDAVETAVGGLVGKQCDRIEQSYSRSRIIQKDLIDSYVGELVGLNLTMPE